MIENSINKTFPMENSDQHTTSSIQSQWDLQNLADIDSSFTVLNRFAKRPPINILFEEISYTVRSHSGKSEILQNISGEFRPGELSCIIGPSGAGKSSLLNILAGYNTNGGNGAIRINGCPRDMRVFKKLSCYIMQDDLLQPWLTVIEAMSIAANLKLGTDLSSEDKRLIVEEILQTLGLWKHRHTRCERISGGQCKQLSIALELVNNPPVIFLDEPTTGLDVVSIRKLGTLLRMLSRQGRTIICTIHQPSASLFALFDNVYILYRGRCCYQGTASLIVPFLSDVGHACPPTHNPADFILETLVGKEDAHLRMSKLCQNGKLSRNSDGITGLSERSQTSSLDGSTNKLLMNSMANEQTHELEFATSFTIQFITLMKRMYMQSKRNKANLIIQIVHHVLCAVLVGSIFYQIGNDGAMPTANFKFLLCAIVFFVYTYFMTSVLLFPTELRLIRREYFNRWYGIKAYFAAFSCASIPKIVVLSMVFISVSYVMTGQPLEWDRFIKYSISGLLTCICSQGMGLLIGILLNETNGAIVGPAVLSPLLVLCCYEMGSGSAIHPTMKVVMSLSFFRSGLAGLTLALYQKRPLMNCNIDLCPYADTTLIVRDVGMANYSYNTQMLILMFFIGLYRTLAYFALRYRLSTKCSNEVITRMIKFLKKR